MKIIGTLLIFKPNCVLLFLFLLSFCAEVNDPNKEDTPEVITKVTLTFTPKSEGESVIVSATDPDQNGPQGIAINEDITLDTETSYDLSVDLVNSLYEPSEDGHSVTEEVKEGGDEHQFFYAWTKGLFDNPTKDGNIGKSGTVNYTDKDKKGLPLGLKTTWITNGVTTGDDNTFRILLQHQPNIKSKTSSSQDGESDMDISFRIYIK